MRADIVGRKENGVIYIASGFRFGRTRESVTFMCTPAARRTGVYRHLNRGGS